MNASLLAALASPTRINNHSKNIKAKRPSVAAAANLSQHSNKENRMGSSAEAASKTRGLSSPKGRPAPAYTAMEPPSTPGRMENLRLADGGGGRTLLKKRLTLTSGRYY